MPLAQKETFLSLSLTLRFFFASVAFEAGGGQAGARPLLSVPAGFEGETASRKKKTLARERDGEFILEH